MPLFYRPSTRTTVLHCAAGIVLLSGIARAETQIVTATDHGSYLGDANQTTDLNVPSFNPNLGTLESINIVLKYNLCPVYVITNITDAKIAFSGLSMDRPITSVGPGGLDLTTTAMGFAGSGHAQAGTSTLSPERSSTFDSESVDPTDFALWEGLNEKLTFAITPGDLSVQGTGASPGLSFSGRSMEWAGITVTYTYLASAAAPEPSGRLLAFLAGAAMVVGIGSRLRQRGFAA